MTRPFGQLASAAKALGQQAERALGRHWQRAALLALEAVESSQSGGDATRRLAEQILRRVLAQTRLSVPWRLDAIIEAMAFDGERLVIETSSGRLLLAPQQSLALQDGSDLEALDPDAGSAHHFSMQWGTRVRTGPKLIDGRQHLKAAAGRSLRSVDLFYPELAGASMPLRGHAQEPDFIAFSPGGHWLASASIEGESSVLRLWQVQADRVAALPGEPDQRLVSALASRRGLPLDRLPGGWIRGLKALGDRWLVACREGHAPWIWDTKSSVIVPLVVPESLRMIAGPDRCWQMRWPSGSTSETVLELVDPTSPGCIRSLSGPEGIRPEDTGTVTRNPNAVLPVTALGPLVSRQGGVVVVKNHELQTYFVWDLRQQLDGDAEGRLEAADPHELSSMNSEHLLSAGGRWLVGQSEQGEDWRLEVWRLGDPGEAPEAWASLGLERSAEGFRVSGDERWLVWHGDGVWAVRLDSPGQEPVRIAGPELEVTRLACSRHDLAFGTEDGSVFWLSLKHARLRSPVELPVAELPAPISSLAWSEPGTCLAAGDWEGRVHLWDDVSSGALPRVLEPGGVSLAANHLVFLPNSRLAACLGNNMLWSQDRVVIHRLKPEDLVTLARGNVARSLEEPEWRRYFASADLPPDRRSQAARDGSPDPEYLATLGLDVAATLPPLLGQSSTAPRAGNSPGAVTSEEADEIA